MFENLPQPLRDVVDHFSKLPGLGPKSALKIALYLLEIPEHKVRSLGESIISLRENLTICERCGGFADRSPCDICLDPTRDDSKLCVVSDWDGLMLFETTKIFKGRYLILGGLLSPLEGKNPEHLRIGLLKKRLSEGKVQEVILALGSTKDAELTESFLRDLIVSNYPHIQLTRLAQGIPVGLELKYVDHESLKQSIRYRQKL